MSYCGTFFSLAFAAAILGFGLWFLWQDGDIQYLIEWFHSIGLMAFLNGIEVLDFDAEAAQAYGLIRAQLKQQGTLIGANDLLIAAHAKSKGLTLITNNTKEFERVEGLDIENWT